MEHQVCTSCLNAYVQPILIPELRGAYSTDDEFHNYMRENFFPGSSDEDVAPLLTLYPNDPAQGSPFGTGDENQFAPNEQARGRIPRGLLLRVSAAISPHAAV